jgi:NAD(P)H dehydrogenase (quinone)
MVHVVVVYHSGFGHTAKVAQAVGEGAQAEIISVDSLDNAAWARLDAADAIIFGAPTYMGSASAPFKAFMDASSSRWFSGAWKNKIAAGFTNSGHYSGDKLNTLIQLAIFAAQHGMIWVGNNEPPASTKAGMREDAVNRLGCSLGLETQSHNDSPEVTPPAGDLETARLFGKRVADVARQMW